MQQLKVVCHFEGYADVVLLQLWQDVRKHTVRQMRDKNAKVQSTSYFCTCQEARHAQLYSFQSAALHAQQELQAHTDQTQQQKNDSHTCGACSILELSNGKVETKEVPAVLWHTIRLTHKKVDDLCCQRIVLGLTDLQSSTREHTTAEA